MTVEITIRGGRGGTVQRQISDIVAEIRARFGDDSDLGTELLKEALDRWGATVLDARVQENLAGRALNRRTGQLANRTRIFTGFAPQRTGSGSTAVKVEVQSVDVPYARIQEFGGTIRPREKQFLTVPLPAALTPAGVLRNTAEQLRQTGTTFVARSRRGNLLIFQRRSGRSRTAAGSRAQLTPLFVLRTQVTLEPTQWASSAVDAALPELPRFLENALRDLGSD